MVGHPGLQPYQLHLKPITPRLGWTIHLGHEVNYVEPWTDDLENWAIVLRPDQRPWIWNWDQGHSSQMRVGLKVLCPIEVARF
jgi:hypothetical protein